LIVAYLHLLGFNLILVMGLMSGLWGIYYIRRNSGIVDLGWTFSFSLIMGGCILMSDGWEPRKWLLAGMVWIWSFRLLRHIYKRYITTDEDPRYQEIRKKWGTRYVDLKVYFMFIFQGLIALVLSLPFFIVSMNKSDSWSIFEGWGVILWFIGVCGEALADKQLRDFKNNPENEGHVCQRGLWNYSRHPNYFFEFVTWLGFGVFALGSTGGLLGLISPLLMLILLLKVSGIPLAEEQSLKSKPVAYKKYQQTTSAFVPWFKTENRDE